MTNAKDKMPHVLAVIAEIRAQIGRTTAPTDLMKLLDRLGDVQAAIVSAVPLRPTLEEIVLQEIDRASGDVR